MSGLFVLFIGQACRLLCSVEHLLWNMPLSSGVRGPLPEWLREVMAGKQENPAEPIIGAASRPSQD